MRLSTASICALHLIGNALVLWLGYYWLGIGESSSARLVWSAFVIVAFVCSGMWLHGTALAFFDREGASTFRLAARSALRNLLPLFVLALAAAAIYWLLAYWHNAFGHKAFVIASYITMKLRKPVSPARVLKIYHAVIWLFRWLIAPALLFPLAAAVAQIGWRGFRWRALRRTKNVLYWLEVCGLLLLAVWIPLKLIHWIPVIRPMSGQMASFVARSSLAYLLFVAALLTLEFLTSAGRPRLIQPSTTSSP